MITGITLTFLVNVAGGVLNWTYKELGRFWTQAILFVVALIAALYLQYSSLYPSLVEWLKQAALIFSGAVAAYEVLLKYFPLFAGPKTDAA